MKVGSQAKVMSKNNSIVIITKGQKADLHRQHNFEHGCMLLAIQHSKLDATKFATKCAIFAHVMTDLKQMDF